MCSANIGKPKANKGTEANKGRQIKGRVIYYNQLLHPQMGGSLASVAGWAACYCDRTVRIKPGRWLPRLRFILEHDHTLGDATGVHVGEGPVEFVELVGAADHFIEQQLATGIKLEQARKIALR